MLLLFTATNSLAQDNSQTSLCSNDKIVIVFFNGIKNTPDDAEYSLYALKAFYGETDEGGEEISYELLYNPTFGFLEDILEVLEQLRDEHAMFFFDIINGGSNSAWYETAKKESQNFQELISFTKNIVSSKERDITLSMMDATIPTQVTYSEHRVRLDNWMLEGKKLLFVAHSQGNLFANVAYNYVKDKVGADAVKVVHVAPASYVINGDHVLADKDLVIATLKNGLQLSLQSITDTIPTYDDRPAGVNGKTDFFGHGFVEIYINPNLTISQRVKRYISEALNSLIAPQGQATSGFFTATLTWDGSGDVDLHTYEPDGSHVYYANRRGTSGYLDVDNIYADGPEHYYASCDASDIKTGTYVFKVANFARAENRTAAVQLAVNNYGVLGTTTVKLGRSTGNNPVNHMFSVFVSKDERTNAYRVVWLD
jgi:hypothetical protein